MAAKKPSRSKTRKISRAKATKKSSSMSGRKAPKSPMPKDWI
jgi:hypothetical protein